MNADSTDSGTYDLVVAAVKTPALLVLTAWVSSSRFNGPQYRWHSRGVILFVASFGSINIGMRHILPIYTGLSVCVGGARLGLGTGLLTSDGPLWRQQRKLIQPAFRHDRLAEAYGDVISEYAQRMVNSFEDGELRNIDDDMGNLTLAIVVKSLFGEEITRDAAEIGELLLAVADATNERFNSPFGLLSWIPTRRNLREKRALARFDEIIRALIRTCRESPGQRDDLLSALLSAADADTGAGMSDRQLRDEMMTMFLAGRIRGRMH